MHCRRMQTAFVIEGSSPADTGAYRVALRAVKGVSGNFARGCILAGGRMASGHGRETASHAAARQELLMAAAQFGLPPRLESNISVVFEAGCDAVAVVSVASEVGARTAPQQKGTKCGAAGVRHTASVGAK